MRPDTDYKTAQKPEPRCPDHPTAPVTKEPVPLSGRRSEIWRFCSVCRKRVQVEKKGQEK